MNFQLILRKNYENGAFLSPNDVIFKSQAKSRKSVTSDPIEKRVPNIDRSESEELP